MKETRHVNAEVGLRPRRVAILLASLEMGGAESVALHLAEAFAAKGIATDLVVVRRRGELLSRVSAQIRLVDLGASRAVTAVAPFRRYLRAAAPEAVIAINFEMNVAAAAAMVGFKPRPALMLTVHSAPSRYFCQRSLRTFVQKAASRILYHSADAVVAVSQGAAEDLKAMHWVRESNLLTIHNPVVPSNFSALVSEPVDHPWMQEKACPVVLTVGRLTAAKDHRNLLEAFAIVRLRRPAKLMIIGEGECREEIENLIELLGLKQDVELLGFRANPYPFMRAADVFVLSSAYEGFGNVLVEAMAAGCPVVTTDCPHGPREIVEGGAWGELVPPGDPNALSHAIDRVLDGKTLDATERAFAFTVEAGARAYLALVEELVALVRHRTPSDRSEPNSIITTNAGRYNDQKR